MFQLFMVLVITKKYHPISLSLAIFKYLNFIDLGTWTLLSNKVHCTSFKLFDSKKVPIKTKQKHFQEVSGKFIVS